MRRRDKLVSPGQAKGSGVRVEGGYFEVLGAIDESDDHESLGEALFESDAEFSDENIEEAIQSRDDRETNQDGSQEASSHLADEPGGGETQHVARKPVARGITRPTTLTKQQLEKHYLEGHANYLAGCEYCVRCRGRADRHSTADKDSKEYLEGEDGVPMISMDFCFLAQKTQDKSTPALVIKEHRTKYMGARACPGKSTVQEEYSNQVVEWTA